MGQPKKQSSPRKTGLRRSHLRLELARRVNAKSPVKVRTTKNETGKALAQKATVAAKATDSKPKTKKDVALAA
jgi:ribosomal protein L32